MADSSDFFLFSLGNTLGKELRAGMSDRREFRAERKRGKQCNMKLAVLILGK